LHEAIDEFLFLLRRRGGEGATAFASRFTTQLNRLETLIAQECDLTRPKKKKRRGKKGSKQAESEESDQQSSESDKSPFTIRSGPNVSPPPEDETDVHGEESEQPQAEAAAASGAAHEPAASPASKTPTQLESVKSPKASKKAFSTGTWKADQAKVQLHMQRVLGTVEASHTKPRPIFPQSVLGHLFMRKFGLGRDQRAQVIRATGGSSRFDDIEKILRASDFEESKDDRRGSSKPPAKIPRRDAYAVQQDDIDEESSLEVPLSSDSDQDQEVYAGEHASEQPGTSEDEIQEVLEIQRKAKKEFKKNFKKYKDSKKKVRDIKKARQPYFPVVALNQPEGSGSTQQPTSSGKVEKKTMNKSKNPRPPYPKREDAHLATGEEVTDFAYMVETDIQAMTATELDVLLASIPAGFAILDTGATTSVVGEDTAAQRYVEHFTAQGFPPPKSIELPPVELRGFNGQVERTSSGLRWTVKLGSLHGTIVTYLVPGSTPFLLSRRVLENMQVVIDLRKQTITSQKHGMHEEPLCRSANGHMLIAICPNQSELEVQQCETNEPNESATSTSECTDAVSSSSESCPDARAPPSSLRAEPGTEPSVAQQDHVSQKPVAPGKPKITTADRRRAFQTILKNNKNGIVDVKDKRKELEVIYTVKT